MKIEYNDGQYILYMNQFYEEKIGFHEKEEMEKYFHKLFRKLRAYYEIELSGYYDIHVYDNQIYGCIITMEKEEYEYYDYFEDKLDMRISVSEKSPFLYKLEELYNTKVLQYPMYQYRNQFYITLENPINALEMGRLLEHSQMIYGEEAETVLHFGKKVSREERE